MNGILSAAQELLGRFTISVKFYGVISFLILCLVATSTVTLWQMSAITAEIEEVSQEHMPLTEMVTKVALAQLEQAIYFERALRAGFAETGSSTWKDLTKNIEKFEKYSHQVDVDVVRAEKIAEEAIAVAHDEHTRARYTEILASLKHFDAAHLKYEAHAMEVVGALTVLADGDTSREMDIVTRDEVGQTARAYDALRARTEEAQALARQEKINEEEKERRRVVVQEMTQSFDSSVAAVMDVISKAMGTLDTAAGDMANVARDGQTQTATVAASSEEASTNVQVVASAAEEMSNSIAEVSKNIDTTTQITQKAVADAEKTTQSVNGLAEAATRIGDVVNLINDIAEQTNLLALNATIEAARAGEAGKGFAVVASEVKELAMQTGKATEEISDQITAIQAVTRDSVAAICDISRTIEEIDKYAVTVASAIDQQRTATREISDSVQQAAQGTQEIAAAMTGVQKSADLSGDTAQRVSESVTQMNEQSETLRGQVKTFLSDVRAVG
eukprot:g4872.t1